MIFFIPVFQIGLLYIVAAILPAVFLMGYIYRMDTIEKEPLWLLGKLLLSGVFAVIASMILELIGEAILDMQVSESSPNYIIILAFLVVAVVEEGSKLFFLYKRTWNEPDFNYLFDGIVYSAFVSLGFAALENLKYVFTYGLGVVVSRALFAIPGHLSFSVFMGFFYGRAKLCEREGNMTGSMINLILSFASAVFLHGMYDSCAMMGTAAATIFFYVFVAAMFYAAYRLVKKESREDRPL